MKAYLKDSIKKLSINKSRYISIILIIALGIAFFTGMNSISCDMQLTTQKYLEDSNVYDFQMMYNLGISKDDIECINKIDEILDVEVGYIYDTVVETPQKKLVVRTNSKSEKININNIIEGRDIKTNSECLIDSRLNSMYGYNLGDKIQIQSGTSNDINDIFNITEFEIVGIIKNPVYLSQYYGSTQLENGEVVGLLMLDSSVYKLEECNVLYAKSNINQSINKFSSEYKEKINKIKEKIENVAKIRADLKYENIYEDINKQINEAESQMKNVQDDISHNEEKLDEVKSQINNSYSSLAKKYVDDISILENKDNSYHKKLLSITKNKYNQFYNIIANENRNFINNKNMLEENKIELNNKIEDVKLNIKEQKININTLERKWTIIGITDSDAFISLQNDLDKMGIMGKAFPVIFFIVAALITITTMTRTIEEDRINIGTLKALGYNKFIIMSRYLIYAIITVVSGIVLGTILGSYYITQILYAAYSSLYALPQLITVLNWQYIGIATLISIGSIILVVIIIISKELNEKTANLLRSKQIKNGKNIFLEKCSFIWNRLSFLFKISFRNIFRYKRRLFMTLIGIAGCTALIYTGFSLKASIDSIGKKQFGEIRIYNMEVNLKEDLKKSELEEIEKKISNHDMITQVVPVRQKNLEVEKNGVNKKIFYTVIDSESVKNYINLISTNTNKRINLYEDGVIITKKLSKVLGVTQGDYINIIDEAIGINVQVKITDVVENYLYNYMYLTPIMYQKIYNKEVEYNQFFINTQNLEEFQESELIGDLKNNERISSITLARLMEKEYQKSLKSLMSVVFLCIGCALVLSFVVLFNLNTINIEERKRELATIKLLGFYNNEMESYVFRENIILSIIGTIIGLGMGIVLLEFIMQSAEVETILLSRDLNIVSFIYSSVITLGCTFITNIIMSKKIKQIDMIDSLKSVE